MWLRRVTFPMTIYGISPVSPIWKIKHVFSVTQLSEIERHILNGLAAEVHREILQPRGQLSYLNSNLMLTRALLGGRNGPMSVS